MLPEQISSAGDAGDPESRTEKVEESKGSPAHAKDAGQRSGENAQQCDEPPDEHGPHAPAGEEAFGQRHMAGAEVLGETVAEQLKLDLKAEQEMLTLLSDGVVHCTKVTDFTTRHMLEDMAKDVDQHIDWIEMQLETIKQVGIENYLAEQIKKES